MHNVLFNNLINTFLKDFHFYTLTFNKLVLLLLWWVKNFVESQKSGATRKKNTLYIVSNTLNDN
jgi:hypothetical protein